MGGHQDNPFLEDAIDAAPAGTFTGGGAEAVPEPARRPSGSARESNFYTLLDEDALEEYDRVFDEICGRVDVLTFDEVLRIGGAVDVGRPFEHRSAARQIFRSSGMAFLRRDPAGILDIAYYPHAVDAGWIDEFGPNTAEVRRGGWVVANVALGLAARAASVELFQALARPWYDSLGIDPPGGWGYRPGGGPNGRIRAIPRHDLGHFLALLETLKARERRPADQLEGFRRLMRAVANPDHNVRGS